MRSNLSDEAVIEHYLPVSATDCFAMLYTRYVHKVYSRCYSLTQDVELAQDFTHDIFIKTFEHLPNFQGRSSFSTWLYSISYNYCMTQLRQANRLPTTPLGSTGDQEWPATEDAGLTDPRLPLLARVLKALTPAEVGLLQRRYVAGMSVKQIARHLNLEESAVKMRLKRTRDKARRLCGQSAGRV